MEERYAKQIECIIDLVEKDNQDEMDQIQDLEDNQDDRDDEDQDCLEEDISDGKLRIMKMRMMWESCSSNSPSVHLTSKFISRHNF